MKNRTLITTLLFLGALSSLNSVVLAAENSNWACFKNETEVNVAGKNAKEKKADCLRKLGIWGEMDKNNLQKEPVQQDIQKQTSGGGGGW